MLFHQIYCRCRNDLSLGPVPWLFKGQIYFALVPVAIPGDAVLIPGGSKGSTKGCRKHVLWGFVISVQSKPQVPRRDVCVCIRVEGHQDNNINYLWFSNFFWSHGSICQSYRFQSTILYLVFEAAAPKQAFSNKCRHMTRKSIVLVKMPSVTAATGHTKTQGPDYELGTHLPPEKQNCRKKSLVMSGGACWCLVEWPTHISKFLPWNKNKHDVQAKFTVDLFEGSLTIIFSGKQADLKMARRCLA